MTERNSTSFKKENGNVTVAADDLVQLLNTWTFDSSRDEENFVVPGEDSNAKHSYETRLAIMHIYIKPLIIIRLNYYLTSPLTKIETVTRTSQATFTAECPASIQERP